MKAKRLTGEAASLPDGGHAASPACQNFVAIGLVTHIPNNLHTGTVSALRNSVIALIMNRLVRAAIERPPQADRPQ